MIIPSRVEIDQVLQVPEDAGEAADCAGDVESGGRSKGAWVKILGLSFFLFSFFFFPPSDIEILGYMK